MAFLLFINLTILFCSNEFFFSFSCLYLNTQGKFHVFFHFVHYYTLKFIVAVSNWLMKSYDNSSLDKWYSMVDHDLGMMLMRYDTLSLYHCLFLLF
jgi:hypothetical protein